MQRTIEKLSSIKEQLLKIEAVPRELLIELDEVILQLMSNKKAFSSLKEFRIGDRIKAKILGYEIKGVVLMNEPLSINNIEIKNIATGEVKTLQEPKTASRLIKELFPNKSLHNSQLWRKEEA